MDISYSAAWALGKTTAIADSAFVSALGRLRTAVADGAKIEAATALLLWSGSTTHAKFAANAKDVVASLPKTIDIMGGLHKKRADDRSRWHRPKDLENIDLSFANKDMRTLFREKAKDVAARLSLSTTAHPDGSGANMLFNEQNKPVNTDWAIIASWLLDRYHLYSIPAHYLIPDQTYLPKESLRFFSIDANWIDAFLDGALSVANHKEGQEDTVREAIKTAWNTFLSTTDPVLGYKPLVPTSGFLLRSDVVKKFPDLRVDAPRTDTTDPRPALVRHDLLADDTMLVLFDRMPSNAPGGLPALTFSQPPHQQRFAAAQNVGPLADDQDQRVGLELEYKDIFTSFPWPKDIKNDAGKLTVFKDVPPSPLFDWNSRCLIVPNLAQNVFDFLGPHMPSQGGKFEEAFPSAAMLALQMNDALLKLDIMYKENTPSPAAVVSVNDVVQPGQEEQARRLAMLEPGRFGHMAQRREEWLAWRKSTSGKQKPDVRERLTEQKPKHERSRVQRTAPQPPHFRSLRHPPPVSIPHPPSGPVIRAGKLNPQYSVTIRSAGSGATPKNTIAINPFATDLVVSVAVNFTTTIDDTWNLQELQIDLPYGPVTTTTPSSAASRVGGGPQPKTPNLVSAYPGPGGRMLRNLRLNPLVKIVPAADNPGVGHDVLRIRLLPRATNAPDFSTPVKHNLEMSFILNEAAVCQYTKPVTVGFTWNEIYKPAKLVSQGSQQVQLVPAGPGR
jgi:hypothetical protein